MTSTFSARQVDNRGGRQWYLSDVDLSGDDANCAGSSPAQSTGAAVSSAGGGSALKPSVESEESPLRSSPHPSRLPTYPFVDSDDIVFVPADSRSLVFNHGASDGGINFAGLSIRNESWFSRTAVVVGGTAIAVSSVLSCLLLAKRARIALLLLRAKQHFFARVLLRPVLPTGPRKKRKKKKKKRPRKNQERVQAAAPSLGTNEGEGTLMRIPRTPPVTSEGPRLDASCALASSGRLQQLSRTPRTPFEYKERVEAMASVVSLTGINKEKSLEIANEAMIRRLDFEMKEVCISRREDRKQKIEEKYRSTDRRDAERRHDESLRAMKGEKDLVTKVAEARKKCRRAAIDIFPLGHFCACITVAIVSMWGCLNLSYATKAGGIENSIYFVMQMFLSGVCGCREDDAHNMTSSVRSWHYIEYLIPVTVYNPISVLLETTSCFVLCCLKTFLVLACLSFVHRLMRMFHCREVFHQAINTLCISKMFIKVLVRQSPAHDTAADLIEDLLIPIIVFNTATLLFMLCLTYWFNASHKISPQGSQSSDTVWLQEQLEILTRIPSLMKFLSGMVALMTGLFWGWPDLA